MGDPAAGGQVPDLARIQRGLGGEVEAVEIAHGGEVGDLAAISIRRSSLAGHLALDEEGQGLAQGQLAPRRLVQQAVELVADRGQLSRVSMWREGVVVDHHQPPPTSCSYSSRGRSSGPRRGGAGAGRLTGLDATDDDAGEVRRLDEPLTPPSALRVTATSCRRGGC